MLIKRLAHICIGSNDLSESERFYCDILGMDKVFEFLKNGEPYGFYANAGNETYIEVFVQGEAANYDRPIIKHLCLEVDDLDAVITDVRNNGWEVSDKKFGGDNSWQAWVKDPSGVDIEFMQYTEESSHFTGNPCIVDW